MISSGDDTANRFERFATRNIMTPCMCKRVIGLLLITAKNLAARRGERMRWVGMRTVLLTVGVLLVSFLPAIVLDVSGYQGAVCVCKPHSKAGGNMLRVP